MPGTPVHLFCKRHVDPPPAGSSYLISETVLQAWGPRLASEGVFRMRFMYIVTSERLTPPTPELMQAMGKLADREIKAGRMIDSGGLLPVGAGREEELIPDG